MKSKLNLIYGVLCAFTLVTGVAVHAAQNPEQTSLTGLDEHAVIAVIKAVNSSN